MTPTDTPPAAPGPEQRRLWAELAEAATPGPWRAGWYGGQCTLDHFPHGEGKCDHRVTWGVGNGVYAGAPEQGEPFKDSIEFVVAGMWDYEEGGVRKLEDAAFIAAARTAVPALLASLAAVEKELDAAREALRPFAEYYETFSGWGKQHPGRPMNDAGPREGRGDMPTVEDCARAASLLSAP